MSQECLEREDIRKAIKVYLVNNFRIAGMVESADTTDLKSVDENRLGSSPSIRTKYKGDDMGYNGMTTWINKKKVNQMQQFLDRKLKAKK